MPLSKIQSISMDYARLAEAVLRNPTNRAILERLPALDLADAWLVSGAVFENRLEVDRRFRGR